MTVKCQAPSPGSPSTSHAGTIEYPAILPLPEQTRCPLWSVMIPSYNVPNDYLVQTIESVLVQDPGPEQMQIEVVDNDSTDGDPEKLVKEIGKGRVSFYRQPHNVGMVANFNTCIQRSNGQLIHLLHSDDYLEPSFYQQLGQLAQTYPEADLLTCRVFEVDYQGEIQQLSDRMAAIEQPSRDAAELYFYQNPFRTPAVVIRRRFYEAFGGFCPFLEHTCDWEMWLRVLNHSAGVALNQPLASYRRSSINHSTYTERTGQNLRDWIKMRDIFVAQYPHFDQAKFDEILREAAYWQAANFARLQDQQAAYTNAELWWKLESLPRKLKQLLSTFLMIDRTKLLMFKTLMSNGAK